MVEELAYKLVAWPKSKNKKRNPYQYLLYKELEALGRGDIVEFSLREILFCGRDTIFHLHWPDVFLANSNGLKFWLKLAFLRIMFSFLRLRGIPVVWTAHNIRRDGQKNASKLDRFFWGWFAERVDAIVYMNMTSKYEAEKQFPCLSNKFNTIIPHGHYNYVVDKYRGGSAHQVRDRLSALFFGSITRYKNLYKLFSCFLEAPIGSVELRVMGKSSNASPDEDFAELYGQAVSQAHPALKYFHFEDRFLSDEDLVAEIEASDLVVFPYNDVLNSGAAIFALSVGRPIYASGVKPFLELREMVGADWVHIYEGELEPEKLLNALGAARLLREREVEPDLAAFSWGLIADKHAEFFSKLSLLKNQ